MLFINLVRGVQRRDTDFGLEGIPFQRFLVFVIIVKFFRAFGKNLETEQAQWGRIFGGAARLVAMNLSSRDGYVPQACLPMRAPVHSDSSSASGLGGKKNQGSIETKYHQTFHYCSMLGSHGLRLTLELLKVAWWVRGRFLTLAPAIFAARTD